MLGRFQMKKNMQFNFSLMMILLIFFVTACTDSLIGAFCDSYLFH